MGVNKLRSVYIGGKIKEEKSNRDVVGGWGGWKQTIEGSAKTGRAGLQIKHVGVRAQY